MSAFSQQELKVLDWIDSSLRSDFLDMAMPVLSFLGDIGWFWIALAALCLVKKETRKIGFTMALSLILSLLAVNTILKPMAARLRPYEVSAAIVPLIPKPSGFSFPSGHTSASFAAATAIFCHSVWLGRAALLLAACIGFSRLYLNVHFPSDVLAGAAIGYALGRLADMLVNSLRLHYSARQRKRRRTKLSH